MNEIVQALKRKQEDSDLDSNGTPREDLTLFVALVSFHYINSFSHSLRVVGRGKAPPKIVGIGHFILREPQGKI